MGEPLFSDLLLLLRACSRRIQIYARTWTLIGCFFAAFFSTRIESNLKCYIRVSARIRFISAELIDIRFVALSLSQRLPIHGDHDRKVYALAVLDIIRIAKIWMKNPQAFAY